MTEQGDRTPLYISPMVPREALTEAKETKMEIILTIFERSISLDDIMSFDPAQAYVKIVEAKTLGMKEYDEMKQKFLVTAVKIDEINFENLNKETIEILLDKIKKYFEIINKDTEICFRPEENITT